MVVSKSSSSGAEPSTGKKAHPPSSLLGRWLCVALLFGSACRSSDQPAPVERGPERFGAEVEALGKHRGAAEDPGSVLFIGSSSIRMWKLAESFPELKVINQGFGGSETSDVLHFASQVIDPFASKTVVIYVGDNDIARGKAPEQVAADVERLFARVRQHRPGVKMIYLAIKPSISRWQYAPQMAHANQLIAKLAEQRSDVVMVDVWTPMLGEDGKPRPELFIEDGLHLNAEGYRLWVELLSPQLPSPVSVPTPPAPEPAHP